MEIHALREHPSLLDTLAQALHREFGHFRPGQTLDDRRRRLDESIASHTLPNTFVMTSQSELLGSASIVEFSMPDRKDLSPWLASVYTFPAYRGRGVATSLTKHVIEYMRQLGYRTLYLFTDDQREFYSKLGWVDIEKAQIADIPVTIMAKNL